MLQRRVENSHDPEAWVDRYGGTLYRYALSQTRDPSVAEDLVQETFLAALRSLASFRGDASLLTWLVSILRRKIIDHRRRSPVVLNQETESGKVPDPFDHRSRWRKTIRDWPSDPARQLEDAEFWEVFEGCVQKLPPLLGEAFRFREILRLEISEICEMTGISRQNLAVRLHRARLALRGCLDERWFGEDE